MNLETNELKDLNLANCSDIRSFEDKILIHIKEKYDYSLKLFLFKEGELQLLE